MLSSNWSKSLNVCLILAAAIIAYMSIYISTAYAYDIGPPNVTLITPAPRNISTTGNVFFNCSALDDQKLVNITLYHNLSGSWKGNQSKTLIGTSGYGEFEINDTPDKTFFIWNCLAFDNSSKPGWGNNSSVNVSYLPPLTLLPLSSLHSNDTYYIFEFGISNNGKNVMNNSVSWQLDTNSSYIINSTKNITLYGREIIFGFVEYNYTNKGGYSLKLNGTDGNTSDLKTLNISIASIEITDFRYINIEGPNVIFEIKLRNNLNESVSNINWSLNTGETALSATSLITLLPYEFVFIYINYNYTKTGDYITTATASSGGFQDSKSITVDITDVEVSNLSFLNISGDKAVFEFSINNTLSINLTSVNWTLSIKNNNTPADYIINGTIPFILKPYEQLYVYVDYNLTTTGIFDINATARNGTLVDSTNLTFLI